MQGRAFLRVFNLVVDRDLDGISPIGLNHWLYSISRATYRWVWETHPRELSVNKERGLLEAIRCYGPSCDCEVIRSHDSGIRCVHVWVRVACAFGPPRIAICNGLAILSASDSVTAECDELRRTSILFHSTAGTFLGTHIVGQELRQLPGLEGTNGIASCKEDINISSWPTQVFRQSPYRWLCSEIVPRSRRQLCSGERIQTWSD